MSEPAKILIVDDEPDIVKMLCRVLRGGGYEIVSTTDPRRAVALLSEQTFELLLSDVDMPHLSGHEVMRHARELSPSTVRVLVTGNGTMDAAVRAINEGEVHRFVRKPFEPDDLRAVVSEALSRQAELALASESTVRARRRQLLLEQLEIEHPGITTVERGRDGSYVVDLDDVRDAASALGLRAFLER